MKKMKEMFTFSAANPCSKTTDMLDLFPAATCIVDNRGYITYFNTRAAKLWGRAPKLRDPDFLYCGAYKLFDAEGTPFQEGCLPVDLAMQNDTSIEDGEIIMEHPDGKRLTVLANVTPIHDEDGNVTGAINIMVDITAQKFRDRELDRYKQILVESLNEVFVIDVQTLRFIDANDAALKNLGYTLDELKHMTALDIKPDINKEQLIETVTPLLCGKEKRLVIETRHQRKDGSLYDVEIHLQLHNDKTSYFNAIALDVTERKKLLAELKHTASHDHLTKLYNRNEFENIVQRAIKASNRDNTSHALCYIDLDQFKLINDTCGHEAGDEMLRQLSAEIKSVVRDRDTFARLGGDEFGLLVERCELEDAKRVARTVLDKIENFQFVWHERSFRTSASIGVAPISRGTQDLSKVTGDADRACYIAKERGRNRIHIAYADDEETTLRKNQVEYVSVINHALDEDKFTFFVQEIRPLDSNRKSSYELLLRMNGADGKLLPPGAFLPAAERFGLSSKIDCWVVKHALETLANEQVFVDSIDAITINLSGNTLSDSEATALIAGYVTDFNTLYPSKICIEITETAAIQNLSIASDFINKLKAQDCRLALDDFGSGLSSFGYLKQLPVDWLKIDGMFVKDVKDDKIDRAMVKSINEIGHIMNKVTVAEFVEDDITLGMLKEMGVDYVQGYGIARPLPLQQLLAQTNNVISLEQAKS